MNKYISYVGMMVLAAGLSTSANAARLSVDVATYCGDPYALDEFGNTFSDTPTNVAVVLTNVSGDNGPDDPTLGNLTVTCEAKIKIQPEGRKKPTIETIKIPLTSINEPDFGLIELTCPVSQFGPNATEWKATAEVTATGMRTRIDRCEEVPIN